MIIKKRVENLSYYRVMFKKRSRVLFYVFITIFYLDLLFCCLMIVFNAFLSEFELDLIEVLIKITGHVSRGG
jgi:hypothetical protein